MKISMVEVAKTAGVSIATVSRVMNGKDGFSEETRKKVEEVIEQLGYQKNEMASALKRNFSKSIGVIIPNVQTNYYGLLIEGIEQTAREKGYSVILSHCGENGLHLSESMKTVGERRVEGIVFVSIQMNEEQYTRLIQMNIPSIFLSSSSKEFSYPYIKIDDCKGCYDATCYLLEQGHQDIALVGINPLDKVAGEPRVQGYQEALATRNIPIQAEWIVEGDYSVKAGEEAAASLLNSKNQITAVVCGSDEVALGVMKTYRKEGYDIPKDLSIVGFDDSVTARYSYPELTTVHQPLEKMGIQAMCQLVEKIETDCPLHSEIVPHMLKVRGSVQKKT